MRLITRKYGIYSTEAEVTKVARKFVAHAPFTLKSRLFGIFRRDRALPTCSMLNSYSATHGTEDCA
jgi:hypothetical protein